MDKFYEKYELYISIFLIVIYLITNSVCMQNFEIGSIETVLTNVILTVVICGFIKLANLKEYLGFVKVEGGMKKYLYFVPLLLLISVNLWNGFNITLPINEILLYMIAMLFIGFLEEVIFRGFLFKMMLKDNEKLAILVTSITFGIGHIINLLNGAEVLTTILQIIYAISVGYLFAIIVVKTKSIWPCVITHSFVNALSVFNQTTEFTKYAGPIFLTIVPIIYAIYIRRKN